MYSIDEFANEITDALKEYNYLVSDEMKSAVTETAKAVKNEVQQNSPKRTGTYKKGWTVKKTLENEHSISVTIHNKKKYRLTHLLEHGHAKRNGGRVSGKEHIAPAEKNGENMLLSLLKKKL